MSSPSRIGNVLEDTLGGLGVFPKARKYRVFSVWQAAVGDISLHARPRGLQGDVLYVATSSSVWSQELYFMRDSIMAKVNAALGGEEIKDIKFSEHMWSSTEVPREEETSSMRPEGPADDGGRPSVKGIDDPKLAAVFCRMAGTMARRRRYLVSKGYSVCPVCGCPYPKTETSCPACRQRDEFAALRRAIVILDERPRTSPAELAMALGPYDPYIWDRARAEVESRLRSFIRYRLAAEEREAGEVPGSRRRPRDSGARAEAASAIKKLAELLSRTPYELMDDGAVEKAVGRRYAAIARKG